MTKSAAEKPYPTDLDYLADELRWIDTRCRRIGAWRRFARAGGQTKLAVEPEEEEVHEEGIGDDGDSAEQLFFSAEREYGSVTEEERRLRRSIDHRLSATRRPPSDGSAGIPPAGSPLALDRLCERHGLDGFERNVLLLVVARCFSSRFDALYQQVDGRSYGGDATVETAFNFCEVPFAERVRRRASFSPSSRLVSAQLVYLDLHTRFADPHDLLGAELRLHGRVFGYLVGDEGIDAEFREFSSLEEPRVTFDQVVIAAEDKRRILSVVERHDHYVACRKAWGFDEVIRYGRGVLMLFHGAPGTGKTMTAHAVAAQLGLRLLNVDIPTFLQHGEAGRFLPGLFREARLHDAVLFFDECETLFADRRGGNALMTMLLSELERFEGVAILATNLPGALDPALDRRILVKAKFPEPDRQARIEIWRKHLPAKAPLAADVDVEALADRYEMAGGYIKNAVLVAAAEAAHTGGEAPVITMAILERAASASASALPIRIASGSPSCPFASTSARLRPSSSSMTRYSMPRCLISRADFASWKNRCATSGLFA